MNIAVLGAGFTGLSAAYNLVKIGHTVTIFEQDSVPGGLAVGFKLPHWDWSLEKHYHHWFTNDMSVLGLANDIGQAVLVKRPKTSVLIEKEIFQLDSPFNLLRFSKLSFVDRMRMASVLGFLKINPFWQPLEHIQAHNFLVTFMGNTGYKTIWEPQMHNKFGSYEREISLAWFWARVHKRTASLAYPQKGFMSFARLLDKKIRDHGGIILYNTTVSKIVSKGLVEITFRSSSKKIDHKRFDKLIVTLPGASFARMAPQLSDVYKKSLTVLRGLGAINLILRLTKPLLADGTYWLSICNRNSPVMAVIEHTNFLSKENYGNEHIVYLGNYMPQDHPFFSYSESRLLEAYDATLRQLNPLYASSIIGMHMFKAPFAQPIVPMGYSSIVPSIKTPLDNVLLANMQMVYPWDRGTNYAVELGNRVSTYIL